MSDDDAPPKFRFLEWDVVRWFMSTAYAKLSPAAGYAYLNLCFAAFDEQPDCTLPDDDDILASRCGLRSREAWLAVREEVLACSPWTRVESSTDARATRWRNAKVAESYEGSLSRWRVKHRAAKDGAAWSIKARLAAGVIRSGRSAVAQRSVSGR